MKKEHISDALNMLNDDIIEETNNVRTNAKPKRKWVKWGVAAACLCLMAVESLSIVNSHLKQYISVIPAFLLHRSRRSVWKQQIPFTTHCLLKIMSGMVLVIMILRMKKL